MAAVLRAALALGLLAAVRAAAGGGRRRQAEQFLQKYGYLGAAHPSPHSPAEFTAALRDFQRVSHLLPSGVLDAPTLRQMGRPRCGTGDGESWGHLAAPRHRRSAQHGSKWHKRHLTYRVVNWPPYLPQHEVRLAVRAAFELWSNVSSLVFWEARDGPADIRLTFFHGDHNDGLSNAFDGPGAGRSPLEVPWPTPSSPAAEKPTSTAPSAGPCAAARGATSSWWWRTRSATRWGWSTPPPGAPSCPPTTRSSARTSSSAGMTSWPSRTCTVSIASPTRRLLLGTFLGVEREEQDGSRSVQGVRTPCMVRGGDGSCPFTSAARRAGWVPAAPGKSQCVIFWGTKGSLPPILRAIGTRPCDTEHLVPSDGSPALRATRFHALLHNSPCYFPGKPSRGSAVQLPGRVFTHFQDWSGDLYGGDRQRQGASTYYCHSFFDAVTADADHSLYIFKGGHFWVVSASGNASQPQPLHARWPGLPAGIDACACSPLSRSFYFFKGGRCWRYQGSTLASGFPQKCSARGLPRHPDTALYFQRLRRLVLFKGAKYFVASEETLAVEPYYPRSLRDWDGVPPGTTGALAHRDGSVYFFRDEQYWRFDQAKLRVVATGKWATQLPWMGCWDANGGQVLF